MLYPKGIIKIIGHVKEVLNAVSQGYDNSNCSTKIKRSF